MIVFNAQLTEIVHSTDGSAGQTCCNGDVKLAGSFCDTKRVESKDENQNGHEEGQSRISGIV